MKLIQLNIWQGRLLGQIATFLQDEQPDILCLQEVYSSKLSTPLLPFFSGLERISLALPEGYSTYFSPVSSTQVLGEEVRYGNAILSRYPLTDMETFEINEHFQKVSRQQEMSHNARNLQRVTVQLPRGKELYLLNHHGYWEPSDVGSDITVQKMQKVADIVEHSGRPLILTGDLQIASYSPAMHSLQAQLRDLTQEYTLPTTLSSFGKVKNVACDHICVSNGITVHTFQASDALISDHLALIMEFDLEA